MFFKRRKQLESELADLRGQVAQLSEASNLSTGNPSDALALAELFGAPKSIAGPQVNADTAMRCAVVYACVRLIAGAVSSAPLMVYRRTPGQQRKPDPSHPLASMLRISPNPHLTSATFWKAMVGHKLLSGNAYALIGRTGVGAPGSLTPLKPSRVQPYQAWELGLDKKLGVDPLRLFYAVTMDDGRYALYDQDDMLHIPNAGWDGRRGLSTISAMTQAVGLSLAAEEQAARFFSNGSQFEFVLKYPKVLTPEAAEKLRDYFIRRHAGLSNAHIPPILTEGGDIANTSISPKDSQLIEGRQFSVVDICRFFGVPPVMVGETEKTSSFGAGVENMARWFVMFTLNDHLTDFEQELERKLFAGTGCFAEFDETELTRGDTKTRFEAARIARGSLQEPGILTINEVREGLGYPPVTGGDVIFRPAPVQGQGASA